MKIIINGQEELQSLPGETLGDILETIRTQNTTIHQLILNGREVDPRAGETRQTPATQIETLEIHTSSLGELINKNLANAEDYLCKLIPGIQKAAELFRAGDEQEANKFLVNIIDGIDWFSQITDTVLQAMESDTRPAGVQDQTLLDRKSQLLDLTGKLLEANQNKDWVLLADLLEYEFLPFYKDWLNLLPGLKQPEEENIN